MDINSILLNYLERGKEMYRIAICDDEKNTCNQLETYIKQYMKLHYIREEILIFYEGETLCDYLKKGNVVNLVFLDIELPKISGVEVGKYVRDVLKDEITDIIYISSKTNYALELFMCRPLDFIIKPLSNEKIDKILDVVIRRNGIKSKTFEFQSEGIIQKVSLQEIIYFRSDNKKIHISLCSGEEKIFNGKLSDVMKRITDSFFLQIHKSFFINCDYVLEYSSEWVRMVNQEVLSISKAHRKEVKIALLQHEMQ